MNDYTKLIAHAAAKYAGRPAVLSPLLDSYCGWETKKSRFSSEPAKGDFRIILSAGGLKYEELDIDLEIKEKKDPKKKCGEVEDPDKKCEEEEDPDKKCEEEEDPDKKCEEEVDSEKKCEQEGDPDKKCEQEEDSEKKCEQEGDSEKKCEQEGDSEKKCEQEGDSEKKCEEEGGSEKKCEKDKDPKKKFKEYEGRLKISMRHGSKELGPNNFNWSRDCSYEYAISPTMAPLVHNLAVYWTHDDFLIIQARNLEDPSALESKVKYKDLLEFRLIPTEVIDVLEPALNAPFLKQLLNAIKKKSSDISSYVGAATEVPESNDVLSLLKCIPQSKRMEIDFEALAAEAAAGHSSQEDSGAETSRVDSKDPKSKSAKTKK